jgi:glycosyltransferase involved in cell wall biosynthesis
MLAEGRVSTIIPVHNQPALLHDAFASVAAQNCPPIEIVIVDETGPQVEALAEAHPEVRAIHRQSGGRGAPRDAVRLVVLERQ